MKILCFDIGGTAIKYGAYIDNELAYVNEIPTDATKGGQHILNTVISIVEKESGYHAIGISTAGQVNADEGYIIYANSNIPGYTGTRFKDLLEQIFNVPVTVDNDVNAAAQGEAIFGAGRNFDEFLMLTYGTGVGGASVRNGKIYYGSSYSASEFGAIVTHSDARLAGADYFDGCYEKYASTTALVNLARMYNPAYINGKIIFQNLDKPEVAFILDKWVDEIMLGLATITHIYNPSCIILGGGIMEQPYVINKINEKKSRFIMPNFAHVNICPAVLGNKAGLLGAAYQAQIKMQKLKK